MFSLHNPLQPWEKVDEPNQDEVRLPTGQPVTLEFHPTDDYRSIPNVASSAWTAAQMRRTI